MQVRDNMDRGGNMEITERGLEQLCADCERYRGVLRELTHIHLSVDEPARSVGEDEPDWICRLRKICLHVRAMDLWEIEPDITHVMAPELRSAYEQMDAVWKCIPQEYKFDEIKSDWYISEARSGMLAMYDHPTPNGLVLLRVSRGGFSRGDVRMSYMRLGLWLGNLGLGYALALAYLAEVLGVDGDVVARLTAVMRGLGEPDRA